MCLHRIAAEGFPSKVMLFEPIAAPPRRRRVVEIVAVNPEDEIHRTANGARDTKTIALLTHCAPRCAYFASPSTWLASIGEGGQRRRQLDAERFVDKGLSEVWPRAVLFPQALIA
jgi:hypothetical protein